MVITGFKNGFLSMLPDIVITEVVGKVKVDLDIEGELYPLSETYYPDSDGKVVISGIDKILQSYYPLLDLELKPSTPWLLQQLKGVFTDDNESVSKYADLFYADQLLNERFLEIDYRGFLTHIRKKKTQSDRTEMFSYSTAGQRIDLGVAFREGEKVRYVRNQYQGNVVARGYSTCKLDMNEIRNEVHYWDNQISLNPEDIIFYEVISVFKDVDIDKIRFEMDSRHLPQVTNLLYRNCFGVPETIALVGKCECNPEMEGSFAFINGQYRKYHTNVIPSYTINTGYITREMANALEDLIASDKVFVYADDELQYEVTITDIDMARLLPSNEGLSYSITFRPASSKRLPFTYNPPKQRIFDKTFNHTFD